MNRLFPALAVVAILFVAGGTAKNFDDARASEAKATGYRAGYTAGTVAGDKAGFARAQHQAAPANIAKIAKNYCDGTNDPADFDPTYADATELASDAAAYKSLGYTCDGVTYVGTVNDEYLYELIFSGAKKIVDFTIKQGVVAYIASKSE